MISGKYFCGFKNLNNMKSSVMNPKWLMNSTSKISKLVFPHFKWVSTSKWLRMSNCFLKRLLRCQEPRHDCGIEESTLYFSDGKLFYLQKPEFFRETHAKLMALFQSYITFFSCCTSSGRWAGETEDWKYACFDTECFVQIKQNQLRKYWS